MPRKVSKPSVELVVPATFPMSPSTTSGLQAYAGLHAARAMIPSGSVLNMSASLTGRASDQTAPDIYLLLLELIIFDVLITGSWIVSK